MAHLWFSAMLVWSELTNKDTVGVGFTTRTCHAYLYLMLFEMLPAVSQVVPPGYPAAGALIPEQPG